MTPSMTPYEAHEYDIKRAMSLTESALEALDEVDIDLALAVEHWDLERLRDARKHVLDAMKLLEEVRDGADIPDWS